MLKAHKTPIGCFAALGFAGLLLGMSATPASAGVTSWSGYEGSSFVSGQGTTLGSLVLPSTLTLVDDIGYNSGSGQMTVTDNWTFIVPSPSSLGSTYSGEQLDLANMQFSGTLESVELFSGTPSSYTWLASATISNNTFAGLSYMLQNAGSYFIQVVGYVNPQSTGSYDGNLEINAVPEPASWSLALAGLGLLGFMLRRRPGR
jgi:MYXO-CTERM domain-containing protein